jgi:hypothetical protein
MPTMDADPCFGRLLDWRAGGHCSIQPADTNEASSSRRYEEGTMVLATRFDTPQGSVLVHDFFSVSGEPGRHDEADHLARLAGCDRGTMTLRVEVMPRFDFGTIVPDLREVGDGLYTACGSNKGLLMHCNVPLALHRADAALRADVEATQRGLGGAVRGLQRDRPVGERRADLNDHAAAARRHAPERGHRAPHRASAASGAASRCPTPCPA